MSRNGILGAGSRAGAWLLQRLESRSPASKDRLARTLAGLHVTTYRLTGGRLVGRPGAPTLLLTTTGRKTGQPRTTALFYLPDAGSQVLVASYGGDARHPQWYRNLLANPVARVQLGRTVITAHATVATGTLRERLWPLVVANWPDYADYQARTERELPVVVLTAKGVDR
jgi:deazaflavin-dependent oxidoreductase (nitroreductase family)